MDEPKHVTPRATQESGIRCPYCRSGLEVGERVAACEGCGTQHHPRCFGENRGCATHACGSSQATARVVGEDANPGFPGLACETCGEHCGHDAIVARCGCHAVQHLHCYEVSGRCTRRACFGRRRMQFVTHQEAARTRKQSEATALTTVGLILAGVQVFVLLVGLLTGDGELDWYLGSGTVLAVGVALAVCGTLLRRKADLLFPPAPTQQELDQRPLDEPQERGKSEPAPVRE